MNPYQFKIAECLLNVSNNCFCNMICFFRIPQTRIAIFPLLAFGSHIMPKVLFHQWFFFFLFFQLMTPVIKITYILLSTNIFTTISHNSGFIFKSGFDFQNRYKKWTRQMSLQYCHIFII